MSGSTATCGSGTPPPPPPPEIEQDVDIWNPGGDPGELRRAAAAWRAMANTVEGVAADLDGAVNRCLAAWTGTSSDAFERQWREVHQGMTSEVVPHLGEVAGRLDETADAIEDINDQIHDLYVSIGVAVGVGAVLSVVTLGFSAAASAAAAAAAGARAGVLVARMASILQTVAAALRGAKLASSYAKAWGAAAVVNTTATGVSKAITNPNHNPFDGWTFDDASAVVNGSTAAGVTGGLGSRLIGLGGLGAVGRAAAGRPLVTGGTLGAMSGSGGSILNDVAGGEPINWGKAGLGAAVGTGAGAASAGAARGIARLRARPAPPAAPSVLPSAHPRLGRVPAPGGFTVNPSGLYVPDDALPPGFVRSPGGVITPEPAPAGWHTSPSGLVVPGPPPTATPAVAASGWDKLLGGLLTSAPAGGITKSITARPGAAEPAPVCVPAGP
ncbi:MAG: WXG100 family type VII secretion target [Actinobacteria bacterium]|nr:WXG100 family type VII secretion target [Actinomycetota bacterium]